MTMVKSQSWISVFTFSILILVTSCSGISIDSFRAPSAVNKGNCRSLVSNLLYASRFKAAKNPISNAASSPVSSYRQIQIDEFVQKYRNRVFEISSMKYMRADKETLEILLGEGHLPPQLFADHGVGHLKNIASEMKRILVKANPKGILFPTKKEKNLKFMVEFGHYLAEFHDIGMQDMSRVGRIMHPYFASKIVFSNEFDSVVKSIAKDPSSQIMKRLKELNSNGVLGKTYDEKGLENIIRELISFSATHDKRVPLEEMDRLKIDIKEIIISRYDDLLRKNIDPPRPLKASEMRSLDNIRDQNTQIQAGVRSLYQDFDKEAFAWMDTSNNEIAALFDDIYDTLNSLRVADSLRMRGERLYSSGDHRVILDQKTARPIVILVDGDETKKIHYMKGNDSMSSAEANVARTSFESNGQFNVMLRQANFENEEAQNFMTEGLVRLVTDFNFDLKKFKMQGRSGTRGISVNLELPHGKDLKLTKALKNKLDLAFKELDIDNINIVIKKSFNDYFYDKEIQQAIKASRKEQSKLYNNSPLARESLQNFSPSQILTNLSKRGLDVSHESNAVDLIKHSNLIKFKKGHKFYPHPDYVYIPLSGAKYSIPKIGYNKSLTMGQYIPIGVDEAMIGQGSIATGLRQIEILNDSDMLMMKSSDYLDYIHRNKTTTDMARNMNPQLVEEIQ
jgi:hypothetical protein